MQIPYSEYYSVLFTVLYATFCSAGRVHHIVGEAGQPRGRGGGGGHIVAHEQEGAAARELHDRALPGLRTTRRDPAGTPQTQATKWEASDLRARELFSPNPYYAGD